MKKKINYYLLPNVTFKSHYSDVGKFTYFLSKGQSAKQQQQQQKNTETFPGLHVQISPRAFKYFWFMFQKYFEQILKPQAARTGKFHLPSNIC